METAWRDQADTSTQVGGYAQLGTIAPRRRPRRTSSAVLAIRCKEELEPPAKLPRWMSSAVVGWTLAAAAIYAAILLGWWR